MNTDMENFPDGMSTNEYLATLPVRRRTAEARGRLLLTPRTGLIVVPVKKSPYGWNVIVVVGNSTYPRGGSDLYLGSLEIETAIELIDEEVLLDLGRKAMSGEAA